jgi:hypothetical protein
LACGLGTTSRSGAKVFWFFFSKKELLVFTHFSPLVDGLEVTKKEDSSFLFA